MSALQEEAVGADQARVAVREDPGQRSKPSEVRDRRHATELEREADGEVRDERDGERGEVHHHHVTGVLRSGETGHEKREPDLHEQHEEARHQQPVEVHGHSEVARLVGQLVDPRL